MIKLKGSGKTREAYRDGVLIGHVHRGTRFVENLRLTQTGGSWSKRERVYWKATWANGKAVRWPGHPGRQKTFDHLKTWKEDHAWDIAVQEGDVR